MKKIIKILICLTIVLSLIYIAINIKVKNIEYVGNTRYDENELTSKIFKSDFDRISLVILIKDLIGNNEKIKYINSYKINWITPFTIKIHVKENELIGYIKRDLKNVYFDKDGYINDISDERKNDIPELRGINFKNYEKGALLTTSNKDLFDSILLIMETLNKTKLPLVMVSVDANENIFVYIGNIIVEFGNNKNVIVKLDRIKDIYPEIKDLVGTLDLSDARENMKNEEYIFKKYS